MRFNIIIVFIVVTHSLIAQYDMSKITVIPKPIKALVSNGKFILSNATRLIYDNKQLAKELDYLKSYLKKNNNITLKDTNAYLKENLIVVSYKNTHKDSIQGRYELLINAEKIQLTGDSIGVFYATISLIQLLGDQNKSEIEFPSLVIKDQPHFAWRGMHLDVVRHFFSVDVVKNYIDLLALYKFNTFHWHLTDDQGWRIEIKKYPNLTTKGAYRNGTMIGKYSDQKYDAVRYGGFYTQNEIKEVVAYAQKKHITIVPEIEMPGHALAAIAAYPYLSCTGQQYEVAKGWGVFDEVFCAKDSTFEFIENVLTEVMALFPGNYIHIGGDECPKTNWKKCSHCQDLIKKEGLKDEHELQSYFIKRIEKFVNANGKQIIGWDEILEGGLAPNAAVMSWRGTEGGIDAAKQKHKVVMSPGKPCYFDHYQSKNKDKEPLAIGGFNPLDSVYAYDPIPFSLSSEEQTFIMGAQANVWTEYILNPKQLEYMVLPRMCAMAEVLWSYKNSQRNYDDFLKRLTTHSKIWDRMQLNYAKHFLNPAKNE